MVDLEEVRKAKRVAELMQQEFGEPLTRIQRAILRRAVAAGYFDEALAELNNEDECMVCGGKPAREFQVPDFDPEYFNLEPRCEEHRPQVLWKD